MKISGKWEILVLCTLGGFNRGDAKTPIAIGGGERGDLNSKPFTF